MTDSDVAVRCCAWAREVDLSPIATIGSYSGFLLVETPLPWARDVSEIPSLAPLGPIASEGRYRLQAVVPAAAETPPSGMRIVLYADPGDERGFRQYDRFETVAGDDLQSSVQALVESARSRSPEFAAPGRDVLVCTHGRRDVCCGSRGTDLAVQLAAGPPMGDVGFWRTSHTGGHRFAPTFIVLPEATAWAFADPELVERVLRRDGAFPSLAPRYRGSAGLPDRRLQALEREVLSRAGWAVMDSWRRGSVDGDRVRLEVVGPDGQASVWEADVGPGRTLPVPDCMQPLSAAKKSETELEVRSLRAVAPGTIPLDGESVGWSRPGVDPVEEGRDSAGQGAG